MLARKKSERDPTGWSRHTVDRNVEDFTAWRLEWLIALEQDPARETILKALATEYVDGSVLVRWKAGTPEWIRVVAAP
jgi:hypothetical protein